MTILVLGSAGQVGSAVERRARAAGLPCEALNRKEMDIRDAGAVGDAIGRIGPDVVVNCAAYTRVDDAEDNAERAFSVNRDGVGNIAAAAAEAKIPLIELSTDYVFDDTAGRPYLESDPRNPLGVYGKSKSAGEDRVRALNQRHIIVRTAWVFRTVGQNFVKTMRRLAAEGHTRLRVVDDQTGCPTAADSIARCLLTIAAHLGRDGFDEWGTYGFCGAPAMTWYRFAQEILSDVPGLAFEPVKTEDFPRPAPRPRYTVLDCGRIRRVFGIEQPDWRRDLADVLRELAQ